jgi:hypothetical protein
MPASIATCSQRRFALHTNPMVDSFHTSPEYAGRVPSPLGLQQSDIDEVLTALITPCLFGQLNKPAKEYRRAGQREKKREIESLKSAGAADFTPLEAGPSCYFDAGSNG